MTTACQSVGRDANSTQPCDNGIVAIAEAALLHYNYIKQSRLQLIYS